MKYFVALFLALMTFPVAALDVKAWFVLVNQGSGRTVDEAEWAKAVTQAQLDEVVETVFDTDFFAIDRTIEKAKAEGDGTVVFMMTGNLGTTDSAKYAEVIANLTGQNTSEPLLDGSFAMFRDSGCALVRKPLTGQEFIHTDTIITMNDPQMRQDCYAAAMTFAMNNLDQFGPRMPFDQQVDENALALQAALPAMAIKSNALVNEAAQQAKGAPVRRASNVYKAGEKISLHANLLNVGRFDPGTAKARYEINMDLVVTRLDEPGEQRVPSAFVYKGQSTHRIPVADDYFDNFITAGFSLPEAGTYRIELVLTDLSRPETSGTSVSVPYEVEVVE